MERENGNGNKIILTVIGAATLLVALVGATFAYFSATSGPGTPQTITTGTSNINLTASNNSVENISPTKFEDVDSADSNEEIVKITLNVTGSGNTAGTYDISMQHDAINVGEEGSQGDIDDLKYVVYKDGETGSPAKAEASFTKETETVDILEGISYNGSFDDTYYVYVWVDNQDSSQNNLKNLNFDLNFTAKANSKVQ